MRHTLRARGRMREEGAKEVAARAGRTKKQGTKKDTGKAKTKVAVMAATKAKAAQKKAAKIPGKRTTARKGKTSDPIVREEETAARERTLDREAKKTPKERVFRFVRGTKQNAFLNALAKTGTVKGATELSGVSRASHYRWLEDDAYRVGLERARRMAADILEDEAWRREVDGVDRVIFNKKGVAVGIETRYSDRLMEKLLAANLPEKYKERVEETMIGGATAVGWEEEREYEDSGNAADHDPIPAGNTVAH